MEEASSVPNPRDGGLPESVRLVNLEGKRVFLVATAHVSRESVQDVKRTIERVEPETVCVELCQSRYETMTNPERWKQTDLVKIIRSGKAMLLLASLIMTSFQKRIGKKLGVTPGAEMLAGIEKAEKQGARLVLADRDIQVTLKRTWGRLNWRSKLKIVTQLAASLFVSAEIDATLVEELKKNEKLVDVLQLLATEFPSLKSTLLDERDVYLAQKIRQAPGQTIVAVVGAGHLIGIEEKISTDHALEALETTPRPTFWPQLLKWSIPALIVVFLAVGFFRGGTEHSLGSIYIWVLVNGTLSALGAALALGHPLTVLSAFAAAPLTSLNPMIAAGWVTGLVQAFVKKPTVKDLEELPDAITTVRGFWLNPVSRILLVIALSNLGSALGTFISGSWIAARSIT
ncbi:MAG: TraB/GumN family protein [Acidobacteriota bacterium]